MKKAAPETPNIHEAKPSSSVNPLIDTEAQIADPVYAYHLDDLRFNLYGNHVRGEDPL